MNNESLIKVVTLNSESTGYLFLSYDEAKSFVITSKHSICDQKDNCDLYKDKIDGCCRTCPKEFAIENIHLLQEKNQEKLNISKIFYDKNKDLTIIEVNEKATNKLTINEEIYTESYIARGFNEKDGDWINLDLDKPKYFESMVSYRHLSPNPNLLEKNDNFKGISGSVVFTYHQDDSLKIAKAIIIHNESHNDFGAENLEKIDFDFINNFFGCHVFHRKKDIEISEFEFLKKNNYEWLIETFSDNRAAKHSFGQPLAPKDPKLSKLLPRANLIGSIHTNLYKEDIIFILGKEGVGKSWIAAQSWLSLEKRPLHIFLTAQDFSQLNSGLENFLIKKIIEQTNDEECEISFKKWKNIFNKWESNSNENVINLLVTIDGINQKPNVNWTEIINKISHYFYKKSVKVLVTSRNIFFNERVRRKIIDTYKTVIITDWSEVERNEILITNGINPSLLTDSVAHSLLNPRLLNIALSLFDKQKIQKSEELDVNRILLEHIRQMESENYEEITYTEFLISLQRHAQEIINRLINNEKDDLNYFKGNLNAVAEGRFFEIVEDDLNSYKLKEEGLTLALALEIILQLNSMKRNRKNLIEGLAKVIEPINALDKTSEIIISCLTILVIEPKYYSREVLTSLVMCFISLQNTDELHLRYFATIVENKIPDFIDILEDLCLAGAQQPNFNWVKNSIISISINSKSWPCVEEKIKSWLLYYSLAPDKNIPYYSKKDNKDRLDTIEKNKIRILEKINKLSEKENSLIRQLTEHTGDIDVLVITAFHILAGKPLSNFVPEFVRWSFGCNLNSGYSSSHKDFINLIRYNLVDWEVTRTQLLSEAKILNCSENSNVAKWAYIRILFSTGESNDAKIADELAEKLRTDDYPRGWRRIEDYCATDPCDPASLEPKNIEKAIKACEKLDITQVWNDLNQTHDSISLHEIQTGLARFRPSKIILKYRELITDILYRSKYPLRCGILNIDQHNLLFTNEHVNKLLNYHNLNDDSGIFDDLTESDKNLVNQFSIMQTLPFIEPLRQLEILMSFKKEDIVFIDLIEMMESITSLEFDQIIARQLLEHQIFNLLCYANIKKIPLSELYKNFLKDNISNHNSYIRIEVFKAIFNFEDFDLLSDFIRSNWNNIFLEKKEHEFFYGSLLWLLSAKLKIVEEDEVFNNIHPCSYGSAGNFLSTTGLRKIAYAIDNAFKVIFDTEISFPKLEIIENLSLEENIISLFRVDRREEVINLEQHLKSLSESGEDFEKRHKSQNNQFKDYISYLKKNSVDLILRGMLPEAFDIILNSAPELKEKWFNMFMQFSNGNLSKFYNFILLLAYSYSKNDVKKYQLVLEKIKNSESFINITVGQEEISLQQMAIWAGSNKELNLYRFKLLDKSLSDEKIYDHVLSALLNNNDVVVYDYIRKKISCVEPSQIARGVLVAGCLDENKLSQEVFDKYKDYDGIIGDAYKASLYMYERNSWSKYWFGKMVSTENKEEFWQYMILFTKIVDSRFFIWKESILNKNIIFSKFYQSFRNDINNRCKKWKKERDKKLFGSEPPNPIYIRLEG
ncbi:hypothetical protein PJ15_0900 [Acinetobacter sp. neg1]|uniref:hypothetical protein n=1 Tax=Acinetobacter sp. neg1 TaxID=1561068 RepID=UPI0005442DE9|nr:hypothetical protein [Acinetobacter sp. neg1]KHF77844.1 hypothetical protein PJ15_0900 [Acinetobacter sp. neg1]